MQSAPPAVAWKQFEVPGDAPRTHILGLGRAACRAALLEAAAAWTQFYGPAPWAAELSTAPADTNPFIHEPSGAPSLRVPDAPRVSLCHARGLAGCAIAAPGNEWVGIDAERADSPGLAAVRADAERTGEAAIGWPAMCDRDWPARLWCAKESVVKAEREGADLLGRTLRAIGVIAQPSAGTSRDRSAEVLVVVRSHRGREFQVATEFDGTFVRACAWLPLQRNAPPRGLGGLRTAVE